MTKEYLLHKLHNTPPIDFEDDFISEIIKFFDSNVCIPKGVNRHPYADVLHEWIERGNLQKRYQISHDSSLKTKWIDFKIDENDEYRIKPSEPVYEWQWCVILNNSTGSIYGFHTEESINDAFPNREKFKIEETKRERK